MVELSRLLLAVGASLMDLRSGDPQTHVRGLAILDPDDDPGSYRDELVLVIGARGREAARAVRMAGQHGASAVAVKTSPGGERDVREAAEDASVALLAVRPQVRWDQLAAVIREVLDSFAVHADSTPEAEPAEDLFALAQSVAALTGGAVSIEDTAPRVLAYSRSGDEVDDLRRLSILGWQGPEPYLELLRQWGVYHRLRTSNEVVRIQAHPELGIRARLAIGIRAGNQHLGAIWVQQGNQPFSEHAESALIGAARLAAVHLLRRRGAPGRSRGELVAGLLDGSASADLVAGQLGLDSSVSAVVAAFEARGTQHDRPTLELQRVELATTVSVHMTSFRRGALVGAVGSRVYAVLPEVRTDRTEPGLITLARDVVAVLRRRSGQTVQVGIGGPVSSLADVPVSRSDADRVLDALARTPETDVATITDRRADVLLGETLKLLEEHTDLRDPAVRALVDHDADQGTDLARSLLAYLDAMGDVRSAAAGLHIHPNTLRHRVRRATEIGGLTLEDPRERLCCHLQLLLATRQR